MMNDVRMAEMQQSRALQPKPALAGGFTLMHCIVMWLMTRMMPRDPATASRG